jgi:type I restriction enzyme M protein
VSVTEIEAEDFNCNVRRYVDNAPPPEPHDVRAHLHGGVPVAEVDGLQRFWTNYTGLQARVFQPRPGADGYLDFTPEVAERRALVALVNGDPSVASAHAAFLATLDAWWGEHVPEIERLAAINGKKGNVYALRRDLLKSIERTFAGNTLLTDHQVRGAFARWADEIKADLKSIAASEFPEVLADVEANTARLSELTACFEAANEEDYEDSDDTGVLPGDQVKELKKKMKDLRGTIRLAKRDPGLGDLKTLRTEVDAIEARLVRHKALEDEVQSLRADIRATEEKQDELVAAARAKIAYEQAREVILRRLRTRISRTHDLYLVADRRACLAALENLHAKYAVTAPEIEQQRASAVAQVDAFLRELGYV